MDAKAAEMAPALGYGASSLYRPQYGPFGTFNRVGGVRNAAGTGELRLAGMWRATLAEFFATLAFMFIGVAAIVWGLNPLPAAYTGADSTQHAAASTGYLGVGFVWGCAYFAMLYATQHISGGYLNPAVTLALMLVGKLPLLRGLIYAVAQTLGAVAGAALVKVADADTFENGFGGANVHSGPFTEGAAFYVEAMATAILMWVVLASMDLGHASSLYGRHISALSPLAVGLTYLALFVTTMPVTGGSMNPARSFGSAAVLDRDMAWDAQWIFWVGPIVGAIVGAIVYEVAFRNSYMEHQMANPEVTPVGHAHPTDAPPMTAQQQDPTGMAAV